MIKEPKFQLMAALDGADGGRMIYRDENLKCTMTIVTPKGKMGKRIFEIDGDKRKFTDPQVFLRILNKEEK